MKKTQRHDACETNHPPKTGPSAPVTELAADHTPDSLPAGVPIERGADQREAPRTKRAAPIP